MLVFGSENVDAPARKKGSVFPSWCTSFFLRFLYPSKKWKKDAQSHVGEPPLISETAFPKPPLVLPCQNTPSP